MSRFSRTLVAAAAVFALVTVAQAQTPTPDPAPEARVHPCAVVDPVRNKIVWFTRRHEVRRAWYQDAGDHVDYSRPVPRVVRRLVEGGTGTRLRARCS